MNPSYFIFLFFFLNYFVYRDQKKKQKNYKIKKKKLILSNLKIFNQLLLTYKNFKFHKILFIFYYNNNKNFFFIFFAKKKKKKKKKTNYKSIINNKTAPLYLNNQNARPQLSLTSPFQIFIENKNYNSHQTIISQCYYYYYYYYYFYHC